MTCKGRNGGLMANHQTYLGGGAGVRPTYKFSWIPPPPPTPPKVSGLVLPSPHRSWMGQDLHPNLGGSCVPPRQKGDLLPPTPPKGCRTSRRACFQRSAFFFPTLNREKSQQRQADAHMCRTALWNELKLPNFRTVTPRMLIQSRSCRISTSSSGSYSYKPTPFPVMIQIDSTTLRVLN